MVRYFVGQKQFNPRSDPIEITMAEYQSIAHAKNVIHSIHSTELKFQIIISCFKKIELALFEIAFQRSLEEDFSRQKSSEIVVRLNQELLAFLTAVRAYHDQRPQELASFSSQSCPWKENAEGIFQKIFDSSFEYRVMEAIRNHAQHHRLPITKYQIGVRRQATSEGYSSHVYTLDPLIELNEIANNNNLRKKTCEEIHERKIEWMDLKLAVRVYLSKIAEGHKQIRAMLFEVFQESKRIFEDSADKYLSSVAANASVPFVLAYCEPSDNSSIYLGRDVIEEVERLSSLHPAAAGMSRIYVSTEVSRRHPNDPSRADD